MSKNPEIDFENEKKIFQRKTDSEHAILEKEFLENRLDKTKILKIQDFDDLIKIKETIAYSFNDEFWRDDFYHDNSQFLFKDENDEIKIKIICGKMSLKKFETKFGTMLLDNHGEWRGSAYNITEFGAEQAGSGNFIGVVEYGDNVYALDTLSHLSIDRSRLHEIRKYDDRFEDITIFESNDLTFGGYYVEDNYLYFYSNSYDFPGLYKFNLDNNELTLIEKDISSGIYVESIIKKDDCIYMLACYNLIRYDLNTQNIVDVYTNLDYDELKKFYDGDIDLLYLNK